MKFKRVYKFKRKTYFKREDITYSSMRTILMDFGSCGLYHPSKYHNLSILTFSKRVEEVDEALTSLTKIKSSFA